MSRTWPTITERLGTGRTPGAVKALWYRLAAEGSACDGHERCTAVRHESLRQPPVAPRTRRRRSAATRQRRPRHEPVRQPAERAAAAPERGAGAGATRQRRREDQLRQRAAAARRRASETAARRDSPVAADGSVQPPPTKPAWTADEESRLCQLVIELGSGSSAWPTIAERLGTGRTPGAVHEHWRIMREQRAQQQQQQQEQQLLLLQQQDQQRRQQDEVRRRQQQAARAAVAWTADEESRLRQIVDELGATASKETIAARLGTGRTPAAVQEHWRVMHAPRAAGGESRRRRRSAERDDSDTGRGEARPGA